MSKGLIIALVVIGVIAICVLGFVSWGSGAYNTAVKHQEGVNAQWGAVQAA